MSKKAQKSLSLWERWHRAAMTERASPFPESRHAAISRFFGRAMLSLRLLFSVSVLALSGAPRQLSQRESLWQRGQALRDAKASPFGRGGIAQAMTERASPFPESRHAAISCLFGRAMLSLRLLFSVSVLALSGAPRQLSQRESQKAFFLTGFLHSRRKQGDSRRFY